jgi:hypothetical protein
VGTQENRHGPQLPVVSQRWKPRNYWPPVLTDRSQQPLNSSSSTTTSERSLRWRSRIPGPPVVCGVDFQDRFRTDSAGNRLERAHRTPRERHEAMPSTSGSRPSAPAHSLRDETNVTRCEQVNLLDNLLQGNLEVVWMSRSLPTARSSMALRRTQSCTPSATPPHIRRRRRIQHANRTGTGR